MDDESFRKILQFFSLSWPGYRRVRKGVKKRLARHMQEVECQRVADYLAFLKRNPEKMEEARKLLTVSLSRFFRDLPLWDVIKEHIIPKLAMDAEFLGSRPVRVWSAGCSCGEEVYSLKIVWSQAERKCSAMPPFEVWATDANPEVLAKARTGIYSQSSLRNLDPSVFKDYFLPVSDGFMVSEDLRKRIHWLQHDFVFEVPPGAELDLIFLRNNLLTYYEPPVKIPAFLQIVDALRPGGFLIIGTNERIPLSEAPLKAIPEYRCIFEKT